MKTQIKIISGGQTGVDQAALRAAMICGLNIGGWCPPGRECDAGIIPAEFTLTETPGERSPDAPEVPRSLRTEWNVRDADATLILKPWAEEDPGSAWTIHCATLYVKPYLVCDPFDLQVALKIFEWLDELSIGVLNIAGPSELAYPGIGEKVYGVLVGLFSTPHFQKSGLPGKSQSF